MDINKLKQALMFVALHEWGNRPDGGYTNDPTDPGGETKYGIAKRSHPDVDIKNLTPEKALEIYKREYWAPVGGDNLPLPTCVVAFDSAVNCGVSRALGWLRDSKDDWKQLIDLRKNHYLNIVKQKPTQQKYLKGWLNRLADLQKYCENVVTSSA